MILATLLADAAKVPPHIEGWRLTPGGWIIMILSVGFVTGLLAWCISRVLKESSSEKLHGQLDVDTRDTDD